MSKIFFSLLVVIFVTGCATNDSYNTKGQVATPVNELGSRGATFAGQAQQFHQANMGIDLCPQGTAEKSGGGAVNSGAGDQNGVVTYSVNTTSSAKMKCDFGVQNTVPPTKAAREATPTNVTKATTRPVVGTKKKP